MNEWVEIDGCSAVTTVISTGQLKIATLYYFASAGQTVFSLSTFDLYGNSAVLQSSEMSLNVTVDGLRQIPDDGSGVGGFAVSIPANTITLLWPAGDQTQVIIEVFEGVS